uniref:Uncharacterized protein n=1 Tax=Rhizophora mucronata TaxID=61149 RepID=A0A2P2QRS7_RHIMU
MFTRYFASPGDTSYVLFTLFCSLQW